LQLTVRSKAVQDDSMLLQLVQSAMLSTATGALIESMDLIDNTPCFSPLTIGGGLLFSASHTVVSVQQSLALTAHVATATTRFFRTSGIASITMQLLPGSDFSGVLLCLLRDHCLAAVWGCGP
jgi:hypothetical protein